MEKYQEKRNKEDDYQHFWEDYLAASKRKWMLFLWLGILRKKKIEEYDEFKQHESLERVVS